MKISDEFKTALLVGIGVGLCIGYLAFHRDLRTQLNGKLRKGVKMVKQQARESARELVERGEKAGGTVLELGGKELKHVADKGRQIYREVLG